MSFRIRHCVECPECHTCYLISCSPYKNGSYLVRSGAGSLEEYTLYCSCQHTRVPRRWKSDELRAFEVSKAAHDRGYGRLGEIWPRTRRPQDQPCFEITRQVD